MKKLFIVIIPLFLTTIFIFSGCKKTISLKNYVVELKQDVFMGKTETINLKATYGYKTDLENKKVFVLTFVLFDKETDSISRSISVDYNGKSYTSKFSLNPITNHISAYLEIENFNIKEFTACLITNSKIESITLSSILINDTLSYEKALDCLYKNQPSLINSYIDDGGNFTGKIIMRIVVKDEKSYWYIGLKNSQDNLKALLLDGINGEVLAIRDVF